MLTDENINKIFQLLENGKLSVNSCEIFDTFKGHVKFLKKSSASDSDVILMELILPSLRDGKYPMAAKVWLGWDSLKSQDFGEEYSQMENAKYRYEGLTYEKNMYKYIMDRIIKPGLSQNFIPFIAYAECSLKTMLKEMYNSTDTAAKLLYSKLEGYKNVPNLTLNILITGSPEGKFDTLYNVLRSNVSSHDVNCILVQILHALRLMEKFKIVHADIHSENVMVQVLEKPVLMTLSDTKIEPFYTRFVPKIFDWDRSYGKELGPNSRIENTMHADVNTLNKFLKNKDYYQIMCEFLDSKYSAEVASTLLPSSAAQFRSWRVDDTEDLFQLFKISDESTQLIKSFMDENKDNVSVVNKKVYVNIPKHLFKVVVPIQVFNRFSKGQKERIRMADEIYIEFLPNINAISMDPGHQCQPTFKVGKDLLYPLNKLFTDPFLLSKLTAYLY